jgi:DNA-binding NtrC family response regulator
LIDAGDAVTEAASGKDATVVLMTVPNLDVVLLDYELPDVHDLSLLSTIRRLSPRTSVILMSAYGTPEIARQALALGAYRVVSKPIDMRDVPSLVHEAANSRPQ